MISPQRAQLDTHQSSGPGEAGASWPAAGSVSPTDVRLETLYRAVNREDPDAWTPEIAGDIAECGLNLTPRLEKANTERGAVGVRRLLRIASALA